MLEGTTHVLTPQARVQISSLFLRFRIEQEGHRATKDV